MTTYPASPASVDWTPAALSVIDNIEANDVLGDCVIAEDAHYVAVETGNSGNGLYSYTRAQTVSDYSAITGYNPADPSTDQGTDPTVDLNYRVSKGYADGSKDYGWALVDATNQAEVKYAISTFGNVKMWFGIPDSIDNNMPSASGFVWDVTAGAPNPSNGHAVGGYGYSPQGYTADGILIATWGMLGLVTWAAAGAWFSSVASGGMAVRVTRDWINAQSGVSPTGVNVAALVAAFDSYFGASVPAPTPATAPVPTGPATLANAQAWAASGINSGFLLMTKGQAVAAANAGLAANWPQGA